MTGPRTNCTKHKMGRVANYPQTFWILCSVLKNDAWDTDQSLPQQSGDRLNDLSGPDWRKRPRHVPHTLILPQVSIARANGR